MKYRLTLMALMAVSATSLSAQGGGGMGQGGGGMGQRGGGMGGQGRGMMTNINTATLEQLETWFKFTVEQKTKADGMVKTRDSVATPLNTYRQTLIQQAMAAAGGGDAGGGRRGGGGMGGFAQLPADSQTKLDAAQTKFRESLRSVLTGPQLPTFDSLVQAAGRGGGRGARGGGGGGRGGGGGGGGI